MKKKVIYLFLALLLPVLIFFFLRHFGKNEFDIPIQFQKGVPDSLSCQPIKSGQYFLPDSIFKNIKLAKANLLIDGEENAVQQDLEVKDAQLQLISISKLTTTDQMQLKKCVLFLKEPWKIILVDHQKRIRGYYTVDHRDDLDRLKVELKIILKKY